MFTFADDTTVVGLISSNDETATISEVLSLVDWCNANNVELNVSKTKELVVDFHRSCGDHLRLVINNTEIQQVGSYKFLGFHWYSQESTPETFIFKTPEKMWYISRNDEVRFYQYEAAVESILTNAITM